MASVFRIGLCIAVCASAIAARAAFTDPSQIQTEAYIHLVQGDQSLDSGRLDEALEHYTLSRDFYLQIADEFPDYQPRIVAYRADYCSDQIDLLMLRLGNAPAPRPPPPPPTSPATHSSFLPDEGGTQHAAHAGEEESVASALPPEKPAPNPKKPEKSPPHKSTGPELPAVPAPDPALLTDLQNQLATLTAQREDLAAQVAALSAQLSEVQEQCRRFQDDAAAARSSAETQSQDLLALQSENRQLEHDLASRDANMAALAEALDAANARLVEAQARADRAEDTLRQLPPAPPPANDASLAEAPADNPENIENLEPLENIALPVPDLDWPLALTLLRHNILAGAAAEVLPLFDALPPPPDDARLPLAILHSTALVRNAQASEAVAILEPFAADNAKNANFHAALGTALLAAGRYAEAREALLRATKLSRDLPPETYADLALLYACTSPKNLKSARKNYQKALDLGLPPIPSLAALLD